MRRSIILAYLIAIVLLVQCKESNGNTNSIQPDVTADTIKRMEKHSLNILFSACFGGKSHSVPQLQMADILVERGHHVTFASFDKVVNLWLADHPNIKPLGIGESINDTPEFKAITEDYMLKEHDLKTLGSKEVIEIFIVKFYRKHFQLFRDWIVENKPDVVVCDFFVAGCYDAAYETGTPFVVTINMLSYQGKIPVTVKVAHTKNVKKGLDHSPYLTDLMSYLPSTHETTGFFDRFYDKFIRPVFHYWNSRNATQLRNSIATELNIGTYESTVDRWKQGFVLVNNFFGLEVRQFNNSHTVEPY
jgi:hypothetical protein